MTTLQKIHRIEDEGNLKSTMTQKNMSFKESENLRHFIKSQGIKPLMMWFSATFLYCYQFFLRTSPSVMEDVLRQEFQMNAQSFGLFASFYYIAYSILQIPMGLLIDKIGLRRILTFSAAMCSLGALVFGVSDGHVVAKIGRLFTHNHLVKLVGVAVTNSSGLALRCPLIQFASYWQTDCLALGRLRHKQSKIRALCCSVLFC